MIDADGKYVYLTQGNTDATVNTFMFHKERQMQTVNTFMLHKERQMKTINTYTFIVS